MYFPTGTEKVSLAEQSSYSSILVFGSKPPRQSPDSIEAMVTLRETNISHLKIGGS